MDQRLVVYTGLLALSGLILVVLAFRGFGQSGLPRALEALLGVAFFAYAGYLAVVVPSSPLIAYHVFAIPVAALAFAGWRWYKARRFARRLAAGLNHQLYAERPADAHTERPPFPEPPGPLGSPGEREALPPVAHGPRRGPMPSGLPAGGEPAPPSELPSGLPDAPSAMPARTGRPSGLPPVDRENYTGRHSAPDAEARDPRDGFAQNAYPHAGPGYAAPYRGGRAPSWQPPPGRHRAEPDHEAESSDGPQPRR